MTREVAIKGLKAFRKEFSGYEPNEEMFDMAIKALEQEPCEDAVSRKAVINQIFYSTDNSGDVVLGSALRERIARLPSVTPQEPRKGHWIDINHHHYYNDGDIETTELRCSCCNEEVEWDIELLHKPYYCENCGADMREVKE